MFGIWGWMGVYCYSDDGIDGSWLYGLCGAGAGSRMYTVCIHGMWCTTEAQLMDKLRNMDCGIRYGMEESNL